MNYFLHLELALALAVQELVTPAELRCVAVLMQGMVGMAELSKRALCSKETVTNSGLVVGIPDPDKRGFKVYKLTPLGYELALKLQMKQPEAVA